jgi:hypothetical protein
MMRDELLHQIAALPADADVGIQLGDDHLDIADITAWGNGGFGALKCQPTDLRDVLFAWGLPRRQREQLASGTGGQP